MLSLLFKMVATNFTACFAPPGYVMLNSLKDFPYDSSCYCNSCHMIMLCLHWSLLHQALHVPPEKEIQWSQVRGVRTPGYWFQHDGVPAQCANVVHEYLEETLGDKWIRHGKHILKLMHPIRNFFDSSCQKEAFLDMGVLTKYDQIEPIYQPQSIVVNELQSRWKKAVLAAMKPLSLHLFLRLKETTKNSNKASRRPTQDSNQAPSNKSRKYSTALTNLLVKAILDTQLY
jgi:hypothetical protein